MQAPGTADPVRQCEPLLSGNEESGAEPPHRSLRKDFAIRKGADDMGQPKGALSVSTPRRSLSAPECSSLRIITSE
jgi:hypothetical protein